MLALKIDPMLRLHRDHLYRAENLIGRARTDIQRAMLMYPETADHKPGVTYRRLSALLQDVEDSWPIVNRYSSGSLLINYFALGAAKTTEDYEQAAYHRDEIKKIAPGFNMYRLRAEHQKNRS